jgi:L-2-hydroxyglutarate oxidase LhgO
LAFDFEAVVIGGGAIGLACAAALGRSLGPTLVLEAADQWGAGTSSRNSEVIHAGLYYPTGSLKHLLCLRGRRMLYDDLARRGIAHHKCGKLVVATDEPELARIEALAARARDNDVEGVQLLGKEAVARMEPEVRATGALWSPESGIFDSHAHMLALLGDIEQAGGHVVTATPLREAHPDAGGFHLHTGGADPARITTRVLVNAAGLSAVQVAARISGLPDSALPHLRFAKGFYFGLSGRAPFRHLVYPAPVDGGLGVHATIDLAGRVRFGPDVDWLPPDTTPGQLDYDVPAGRATAFQTAIQRYWPGLPDGALFPDYAGVRPKLSAPGAPPADFLIQGVADHGLPGLVNLFGIESPGLTAAPAIAEHVAQALDP